MSKRKLREWEIPMNLSDKEKEQYGMTTRDKLNNNAKTQSGFASFSMHELAELITKPIKPKQNELRTTRTSREVR
tara:strand:- start:174 stop:398 length:225 start_codon:yes stop_codon:yes gene_type:complete